MQNLGFLRRLMTLGERQALQEFLPYIDYASEASDQLISMLRTSGEDLNSINEQIRENEKKADNLTLSITADVTQGAINATLLGHLLTLTETFDDLLDRSLYISREIKRVDQIRHTFSEEAEGLLVQCYTEFASMLESNKEALNLLGKILKASRTDNTKKYRKQIEELEENIDDMKDSLIDRVYAHWNEINYLVFNHLTGLVHKIDDMMDDCEDISDLVMTVVSSIAK